MAAGTINYDNTKTMWNQAEIWIGCAIPAAGAEPVLINGKPDLATSINAKHIGYLEAGAKWSYKWTEAVARDGQHTAPHRRKIVEEMMTIEAQWKQVLDLDNAAALSVGGTKIVTTNGQSLTFGGKKTIATTCTYVISEKVGDPGYYVVAIIYDGYNTEGLEVDMSNAGESNSPIKIVGNSVASRAAGDDLGQWHVQHTS